MWYIDTEIISHSTMYPWHKKVIWRGCMFTGAQLRHNDFRIFADPSRIFTYNCDETFKTTPRTLSENMPGHARNNYGKSFLFIPYRRYRFKIDNWQHTNNIHSYLLSNNNIIVFIGNNVF